MKVPGSFETSIFFLFISICLFFYWAFLGFLIAPYVPLIEPYCFPFSQYHADLGLCVSSVPGVHQ